MVDDAASKGQNLVLATKMRYSGPFPIQPWFGSVMKSHTGEGNIWEVDLKQKRGDME